MHHHEAAAADIAAARMHHRQGIADSHRRIHGVAAIFQHAHANAGRQMLGRDDYRIVGHDGCVVGQCLPGRAGGRGVQGSAIDLGRIVFGDRPGRQAGPKRHGQRQAQGITKQAQRHRSLETG